MNIGIDIDDTILNTVDSMLKYADLYEEEMSGRKATHNNMGKIKDRYYLNSIYGWDNNKKFDFFNKYYKNVLEDCKPLPGVKETIDKLISEGNKIYFITARLNIDGSDTYKITEDCLDKFGIKYDGLYVSVSDKLTFCKEHDIDLILEDSYETCREFLDNNLYSILVTTKMNEFIDDDSIIRVSSWESGEMYNAINSVIELSKS